jgi:hypothetical protein
LKLEKQRLQLEQEFQKDKEEVTRLRAVELPQKQALRVTQEAISVIETKLDNINVALLTNINERYNVR